MSQLTERLSLAVAGQYRLERHLGEGGMAIVYLAHDFKHDRKVAMKVLRPELAAVLGGERFVQEIKTTAALQHPNILPLFDSGRTRAGEGEMGGEFLYYVMPYVDGETLRGKLDRETQLGIDEAVRITCDLADALDYAHRHGVIHRDIKPENILLHDGRPLIADFGIALAISAAAGGRMTETGLSLGTPHYMSPEQATAEKELSARSDVYSLGCVLYEMLAGEPPHTGASAQAIVMKIVTDVARPVSEVRRSVPPYIAAANSRALEKLPADRFSAKEFANALRNPGYSNPYLTHAAPTMIDQAKQRRRFRATLMLGATTLLFGAIAAMAMFGPRTDGDRQVLRSRLPLPVELALGNDFGSQIVLSPDGGKLVYVSAVGGTSRLWLLERNQLEPRAIPGTEGAHQAFFSPDGSKIGFVTWERYAKVVSLTGEPPLTLADSGVVRGGGTWGEDGFIYLSAARLGNDSARGVVRIPESGGTLEAVGKRDLARGEIVHNMPEWLPGGNAILITIQRHRQYDASQSEVGVLDVRTGQHRSLLQGLTARWSPSGHIVVVRQDGALIAAPFDMKRLELSGPPVPILSGIDVEGQATVDITLSRSGSLMYLPRGVASNSYEAVWVTRDGRATRVDSSWSGRLRYPSLSPDGRQLAVVQVDGVNHIWVKQLPRGAYSKLTFEGRNNLRPAWRRDGQSIAFASDSSGRWSIYERRANGSGSARLLMAAAQGLHEIEFSPDGVWGVLRAGIGASSDLLVWRIGHDTVPRPLIASRFEEQQPAISPDGKWIAYVSNESGRNEVYVRPFPDASHAIWQVSTAGGAEPLWARSGRELFYKNGENQLMAAQVARSTTFVLGEQRVLFSASSYSSAGENHRTYDISTDDQRFLMIRTPSSAAAEITPIVVVDNFFAELKRKTGAK